MFEERLWRASEFDQTVSEHGAPCPDSYSWAQPLLVFTFRRILVERSI